MLVEIQKLTDLELLAQTKSLVAQERQSTVRVLHHLREVERRRLYARRGLSSLFVYCTDELKYSESQAQRRITAMRLIRDIPEAEEKIQSGALSLTVASQAQTFFSKEAREKNGYTKLKKIEVLSKLENKSKRESERELIKLAPTSVSLERVRVIGGNQTELKLVVGDKLKKKLDRLKNLLSHKNPSMQYVDLLDELAEIALNKLDPMLKSKTRKMITKSAKSSEATGRYISSACRQYVWMRDCGECSFIDTETGKKCRSQYQLQIDHIRPLALGGDSRASNLRLLCSEHNKLAAINVLGELKMKRYLSV